MSLEIVCRILRSGTVMRDSGVKDVREVVGGEARMVSLFVQGEVELAALEVASSVVLVDWAVLIGSC